MLFIGTAVDRVPDARHFERLSFAEVCLRPPLPRPATLKRLRHEQAEHRALALRLPPSLLRGSGRFDDVLREHLAWTRRAAEALDARAIVLPTAASLTPSVRGRELLAAMAEAVADPAAPRHLVWEPHGPWEPEEADACATALGLSLAFDPLQQPRPGGATLYARVRALGERSSLSDATLEDVLDAVSDHDGDCFVVIDSPRAFKQAARLGELAAAALG